jgi:hypothetical protein
MISTASRGAENTHSSEGILNWLLTNKLCGRGITLPQKISSLMLLKFPIGF